MIYATFCQDALRHNDCWNPEASTAGHSTERTSRTVLCRHIIWEVDKRSAGKLQFPHFAKITVPGTVCSDELLCIFSVMTNSAQPFGIHLPNRRYNRHALHQQVKLLLRNGHGLFLGSWPTEASRGKSFVYEQISVSFKNEAFDSVCLCPTEQEQDIFLRGI